jgi:argininosuccinate lyase
VAVTISGLSFRPEKIRLDPGIHAAEQANRLVTDEGIPFRDAYRRVAGRFTGKAEGTS